MTERLAFLGMGIMGAPMARNLLRAGYPVRVYNRTAAKADALRAQGAAVADSPAAACRHADVVLACLFDAAAVEAVVTGPQGVLEGIGAGTVFVDLTTNSPPVSRRLAGLLAQKGAAMLDAPVSGGDVGAREGALSIMVGGDRAAFERCRPIFEVLGGRITHMGQAVGAGGFAKLANQIMVAVHLAAMGEALVFGAKAGLELPKLVGALTGGMANSAAMELKQAKVLNGDFAPGAEARVQLKDLRYIRDSMAALNIDLPLSGLMHRLYGELVDAGYGAEDHSAIVRLFERLAGIEARG